MRLLLVAAILALVACGGLSPGKIDSMIAPYADEVITISGLTDEEFTVTVAELAALELVSVEVSGARANGKQLALSATGPTLETLVSAYGFTQTDFYSVRFIAADDYVVTIHAMTLEERQIILTLGYNGEPLPTSEAPLRIVIPGLETNQWPYLIQRIEFS
jgi:hypothetical protein